jgi:RNA methyltransferase, TrmH family
MHCQAVAACDHRRVQDGSLIPRFGRARRDPQLAVLEGFHPLKHALRFGANVLEVVTSDATELERLAGALAPELAPRLRELAREIDPAVFEQLAPLTPSTGVMALAQRPAVDVRAVLAGSREAPVVLLEDPRDLGNMGACVRVSAAAGAAGVLTTGSHDPWHPDALRGGAGLHYALPVARARPRRRRARPTTAARTLGARVRHRAPRSQPRAARERRRAHRDPDARGRLEPQPGHLRGGRPVRLASGVVLEGGS